MKPRTAEGDPDGSPSARAGGGSTATDEGPPRLAEGVELIGQWEGSGYKDPPYMVRRQDGQVVQVSHLLFAIAERADGERDTERIAAEVSETLGRSVTTDNVATLLEKKLRPLGLLVQPDGQQPEVAKPDVAMQLTMRTAFVPERLVRVLSAAFAPLFAPPVVVVVLLALIAVDVWAFGIVGIGAGVRESLYQPAILLAVFAAVVASAAFHEIGHAAACRYGGATPGKMGAGIYYVWPAFYTDVTDAYRLGRAGRVRVDLGGVYFNAIVVLLTAGAYALTRYEPLLLILLVQHLATVQQFLPFVRLDGYYVVSDLVGVPDLFPRIRPILRSLRPGRDAAPEVDALKPWARAVVTGWVLLVVPVLALNIVVLAVYTPRILATSWDSALLQVEALRAAGDVLGKVAAVVQIVALALPVAGIAFTLFRLTRKVGSVAHTRIRALPAPARRTGLAVTGAIALAVVAYVAIPNGDYKPLQPAERLTLAETATALRALPGGRPGLTPEREEELGGAPGLYEQAGPADPIADPTATPEATATPGPEATADPTAESSATADPTAEATAGATAGPAVNPAAPANATTDPTTDPTADPTAEATATAAEATAAPTEVPRQGDRGTAGGQTAPDAGGSSLGEVSS